jgi:transmembrane sensor
MQANNIEIIKKILFRKAFDELTPKEEEILIKWSSENQFHQRIVDDVVNKASLNKDLSTYDEIWNEFEAYDREKRIFDLVKENVKGSKTVFWKRLLPYAAIVSSIVFGFYLYEKKGANIEEQIVVKEIIKPGGNRAKLSLSNSASIDLNDEQSGIVIGDNVTYLDGTKIFSNLETTQKLLLETPAGGNYQVILPDGTKVWLNSSTRLSYPVKFDNDNREIDLDGEAYFEVKSIKFRGKQVPFKITTKNQIINVLGTSFNVNAYSDDVLNKTTLLSGSVKVENTGARENTLLKPGQQAVVSRDYLKTIAANINSEIAWKNGQFSFDGKSFDLIMKEMARWYNLKIIYQGSVPEVEFIGNAYKTENLNTVLDFLESSTLAYQIVKDPNGSNILIIKNRKEEK